MHSRKGRDVQEGKGREGMGHACGTNAWWCSLVYIVSRWWNTSQSCSNGWYNLRLSWLQVDSWQSTQRGTHRGNATISCCLSTKRWHGFYKQDSTYSQYTYLVLVPPTTLSEQHGRAKWGTRRGRGPSAKRNSSYSTYSFLTPKIRGIRCNKM